LRAVAGGGERQPHRRLSLCPGSHAADESPGAPRRPHHQQWLHQRRPPAPAQRALYRDQARHHRPDQIHHPGWTPLRHHRRPDRYRQCRHRDDRAHGQGRAAAGWRAEGRAAHGRGPCRPTGGVHGRPAAGIQRGLRHHHGHQDAAVRPRLGLGSQPQDARPVRLAAAILVIGFGVMLALNAPGQLSYDSVTQLADGRSGHYNSWHPPLMAWLLGLFDSLVPGTFLFLLFQGLLLLAGLLALLALKPRGWLSMGVALLIVLTPQWLLYQGEIWKDMLFADAAIAGFAALAWYAQRPHPATAILTLASLLVAAAVRQNGIVLLPVAAVTLALTAPRRWRWALAFLAAGLVLLFGLNLALASRGDGGDGAAAEIRLAQSYDLAGAFAREPNLSVPLPPDLDQLLRGPGARLYTPLRNDPFAADLALSKARSDAPDGAI